MIPRLTGLLLLCCSLATAAAPIAERVALVRDGLGQPSAVAVAPDGRILLLDGLQRRILVYSADAAREAIWPLPTTEGAEALPATDLALGDGRLFVADPAAGGIWVLDAGGAPIHRLQPQPDGLASEPSAVHFVAGRLWWSDRRNHRICRSQPTPGGETRCWGEQGDGREQFHFPYMLAADGDGYLLAVDVLNARVQMLSPRGRGFGSIGRFGFAPGDLFRPNGIAVGGDGRVFVSDVYRGTVGVFERRTPLGVLHDTDGKPWHFEAPVGLARHADRLYVVDMGDDSLSVLRLLPDRPVEQAAAAPGPAPDSRRNCLQCHLSWSGYGPATQGGQVLPVGGERMCFSCHHGAVVESRQRLATGHQHPTLHRERDGQPAGDPQRFEDEVPAAFPRSADGRLYCGSCHSPHDKPEGGEAFHPGVHNPWLRLANPDNELCVACHGSKVSGDDPGRRRNHPVSIPMSPPPTAGHPQRRELQQGLPHALGDRGARLNAAGELTCQSCHRVHGAAGDSLLVDGPKAVAQCVGCHRSQHATSPEQARRKGVHPLGVTLDKPVRLGGREVRTLDCLSCHSVHDAEPGTALLVRGQGPDTLCKNCHEPQTQVAGSDHDLARSRPERRAPGGRPYAETGLCGGCHSVHRATPDVRFLYAGPQPGEHPEAGPRDRLCLGCHEKDNPLEAKVIEAFTHPFRDLILRSPPETLPLLDARDDIAEFGRIGCITCHDPHHWRAGKEGADSNAADGDREGTVLDSFLRLDGVEGSFCVDCHGRETRVKYLRFHDAEGREKGLDYLK